ncbi:hypothetical protein LTR36_009223 [Oleoguttula mirabilis]|uniref:Uncharacterized protein n=1 Tax=Oleoguttula mirabilis TaxID=1507867 RepID=A0AAV9J667_9PEZI|nr:hypothetical protein LTR36_009223 [Oleoguttula mirabilis]
MIFPFGPEKSYFMSPALGRWRYCGHKDIASSFSDCEINQPGAIALAPEGDFGLLLEEHDRSMSVKHFKRETMIPSTEAAAFVEARRQYESLYDFIRESKDTDVRRMTSLSVRLGGSWFARIGGQVAYHGLPPALLARVEERESTGSYPFQVTLGLHDSYAVIWSDDSLSWTLHGYGSLAQYLQEAVSINMIVLSRSIAESSSSSKKAAMWCGVCMGLLSS